MPLACGWFVADRWLVSSWSGVAKDGVLLVFVRWLEGGCLVVGWWLLSGWEVVGRWLLGLHHSY